METILTYEEINREEWSALVRNSATGTWFQTPEAYSLYASMPGLFKPFAIGVLVRAQLRGVCVGYVTKEKNAIKQYLTRRAIIIGGPVLADDATEEEVESLMEAVRKGMLNDGPIYIETRNLNDYSQWRGAFEKAGFHYAPHLNFQVQTDKPWEEIDEEIGKHRRRDIRLSLRDGANIETQPTIEQTKAYYALLQELYRKKVKTPLYPWSFFEKLYHLDFCRFLLVVYEGQVVGGSVLVTDERTVYEWFACGKDDGTGRIHPASVVKYAGMKYAKEQGYKRYDMMGAGRPDEAYGVRDFKAEFGGKIVEHGRFICVMQPILYKLGTIGVKMLKKAKH